MTIKAIVFDMDDTLYDERAYIMSGFREVDRWMQERYQVAGFLETAAFLFETGQRELIFNRTLDELRVIYDGSIIKELVDHYRTHQPEIQLFADAQWVLDHILDSVKLGLISDGYLIAQQQKVAALRLAANDKFHAIILSDRWGRQDWKPSYRPYVAISNQLSLAHHECVYIGDNVQKDFISANKLGWTTIQIKRPNGLYANVTRDQAYQAHYVVDHLQAISDLPPLKHLFMKDVDLYDDQPTSHNSGDQTAGKNIFISTAYER